MPFDGATPGSAVGSSRSCMTSSSARDCSDEESDLSTEADADIARSVVANQTVRLIPIPILSVVAQRPRHQDGCYPSTQKDFCNYWLC
jgi:hypothetical protein